MKSFVLLVTWFIYGQPPSSYQTVFSTREACEAAKASVFADANRLRQSICDDAVNKGRALGLPDNIGGASAVLPNIMGDPPALPGRQ
jgi:hypothetical protein